MTLHYAGGQFTEGPDWLSRLCPDDSNWTRQIGLRYEKTRGIGDKYSLEITLYRRKDGDQSFPPFFIEVGDEALGCQYVSAATFGDAMDLLARWAPAVTADIQASAGSEPASRS